MLNDRINRVKEEYKKNAEFKRFVDDFAKTRDKSPEKAMEDAIVFEVYKKHIEK